MFDTLEYDVFEKSFLKTYAPYIANAPPLLISDLIKIKFFLLNQSEVLQTLEKLETRLKATLFKKNIDKSQFINPYLPEYNNNKTFKILSDTLKEWLQNTSFLPEITVFNDIEEASTFFSTLKQKAQFKDKGSDYKHGEWTHLIQFFLIANNKTLVAALSNKDIADLYAQLGEINYHDSTRNLWDLVFDEVESNKPFQFTCPEKITAFFMKKPSHNSSTPIFKACIRRRYARREENLQAAGKLAQLFPRPYFKKNGVIIIRNHIEAFIKEKFINLPLQVQNSVSIYVKKYLSDDYYDEVPTPTDIEHQWNVSSVEFRQLMLAPALIAEESLINAVSKGNLPEVEKALRTIEETGGNINALDSTGNSALMYAIQKKQTTIVKILLNAQGINKDNVLEQSTFDIAPDYKDTNDEKTESFSTFTL